METGIKHLHSFWAYLVLFITLIATINAIAGTVSKKPFAAKDTKLALFALIATHIQFLVGIVLFFVSPLGIKNIKASGMGVVMKDSLMRLYAVEHPLVMLIAVVLITIGYSAHKRKTLDSQKFKTIMIFYLIALILMLSRIPYAMWFS
ncbi:MAG TPA: hypothetical protein VFF21_07750 [Flavobacteriaceae bacterium]|nr:hypothetical protein [Flavobacteriaceae bacterium]